MKRPRCDDAAPELRSCYAAVVDGEVELRVRLPTDLTRQCSVLAELRSSGTGAALDADPHHVLSWITRELARRSGVQDDGFDFDVASLRGAGYVGHAAFIKEMSAHLAQRLIDPTPTTPNALQQPEEPGDTALTRAFLALPDDAAACVLAAAPPASLLRRLALLPPRLHHFAVAHHTLRAPAVDVLDPADLHARHIPDALARAVRLLASHPAVTSLAFRNSHCADAGLATAFKTLQIALPNLRELDLSGNRFPEAAMAALVPDLCFLTHLTRLALSGSTLSGDVSVVFVQALVALSSLERLALADGCIRAYTAARVARGVRALPALRDLDISNNVLDYEGLWGFATTQFPPTLRTLNALLTFDAHNVTQEEAMTGVKEYPAPLQLLNMSLEPCSHLERLQLGPYRESVSPLVEDYTAAGALAHRLAHTRELQGAGALIHSLPGLTALTRIAWCFQPTHCFDKDLGFVGPHNAEGELRRRAASLARLTGLRAIQAFICGDGQQPLGHSPQPVLTACSRLTALTELMVYITTADGGRPFFSLGLDPLRQCTALERVTFSEVVMPDQGSLPIAERQHAVYDVIAAWPRLRELALQLLRLGYKCPLHEVVGAVPDGLEVLELGVPLELEGALGLSRLVALRKLCFDDAPTQLWDEGLMEGCLVVREIPQQLVAMGDLRDLRLRNPLGGAPAMRLLAVLPQLTRLTTLMLASVVRDWPQLLVGKLAGHSQLKELAILSHSLLSFDDSDRFARLCKPLALLCTLCVADLSGDGLHVKAECIDSLMAGLPCLKFAVVSVRGDGADAATARAQAAGLRIQESMGDALGFPAYSERMP